MFLNAAPPFYLLPPNARADTSTGYDFNASLYGDYSGQPAVIDNRGTGALVSRKAAPKKAVKKINTPVDITPMVTPVSSPAQFDIKTWLNEDVVIMGKAVKRQTLAGAAVGGFLLALFFSQSKKTAVAIIGSK
jgi:hypothetical protein